MHNLSGGRRCLCAPVAGTSCLKSGLAASDTEMEEVKAQLKAQIDAEVGALKKQYDGKIRALEKRVNTLETENAQLKGEKTARAKDTPPAENVSALQQRVKKLEQAQ